MITYLRKTEIIKYVCLVPSLLHLLRNLPGCRIMPSSCITGQNQCFHSSLHSSPRLYAAFAFRQCLCITIPDIRTQPAKTVLIGTVSITVTAKARKVYTLFLVLDLDGITITNSRYQKIRAARGLHRGSSPIRTPKDTAMALTPCPFWNRE